MDVLLDKVALGPKLGIAPLIAVSLLVVGCPERPPRYVDEDADAGPQVFTDEELRQWEQCPPRVRALPIEGGLWLQTTPHTIYCSANALRTQSEPVNVAFNDLTQVRLVPDDLFFPLEDGVHEVGMGSCKQAQDATGRTGDVARGATWTVSRASTLGAERIEGRLFQPFPDGSALRMTVSGLTSAFPAYPDVNGGGVLLDGAIRSAAVAPAVTLSLCRDAECEDVQLLEPCAFLDATAAPTRFDRVDLTLSRGELSLLFEVNEEDDTQVLLREATGTFDDAPLQIESHSSADAQWNVYMQGYGSSTLWNLWLRVWPPIDDVCGLGLFNFDPFQSRVQVVTSRCDDANLQTSEVFRVDYESDVDPAQ